MDELKIVTKSKSIMLRLAPADYLAVRNAALARGLEMGPMLLELLGPMIKLLQASQPSH